MHSTSSATTRTSKAGMAMTLTKSGRRQGVACPSCEKKTGTVLLVGQNANRYNICSACAHRLFAKNNRYDFYVCESLAEPKARRKPKEKQEKSLSSVLGNGWYRSGYVAQPNVRLMVDPAVTDFGL